MSAYRVAKNYLGTVFASRQGSYKNLVALDITYYTFEDDLPNFPLFLFIRI